MSKLRKTPFQQEWLNKIGADGIPYNTWLAPVRGDDYSAHCTKCNKNFRLETSGIRGVSSHAEGKAHARNCSDKAACSSLLKYVSINSTSISKPAEGAETMKAELRYCIHFVEHDFPFQAADHSDVLKEMFPDSKIAQSFKCKRSKMAYLLNDAIAPFVKEEIVSEINSESGFYSIAIDESNDCLGNRKFLQIVVSYISHKRGRLIVCPLETIELQDGTAETLQIAVVKTLHDHGILLAKCVTIMSDGPSVMTGQHSGFHVRMDMLAPQLLKLTTCTLHHVSNAVRTGCDSFSSEAESFADDVFAYFHFTSRWTRYKKVI
jgi:hypothetical protein